MMNVSEEIVSSFQDVVNEVRSCHEKAVSAFSDAVRYDESNDESAAIANYLTALRYSEDGLRHNVFEHEPNDDLWNEIREMQERMIVFQGNAKQRIYELQSNTTVSLGTCNEVGLPPPYALHDPVNPTPASPNSSEVEASTMLLIENGVQLYFVSSDDQVGTPPPCYPTSLAVLRLNNGTNDESPEVILQVGEKAYPLVKNQMPVYKSSNGVYMFPNCNESGIVDGSFGIVIPQTVPREVKENFEEILEKYGAYKVDNPDDEFVDLSEYVKNNTCEDMDYIPRKMTERIAFSLFNGANFISHKLQSGTYYTTNAVESYSEGMISKTIPSKSGITVHPMVKKGLEYTNTVAKTTVIIKNWLVEWLRQITVAVGQQVGPYLTQAADSTSETTKTGIDGARSVMHASLTSFAKIWAELENSASKITTAVTSAMVKNVEYKYGRDAGDATNLAIGAVASIGETAFALDNIGAKVIADLGSNSNYSCSTSGSQPVESITTHDNHDGGKVDTEDSCESHNKSADTTDEILDDSEEEMSVTDAKTVQL